MDWVERSQTLFNYLIAAFTLFIAVVASGHAVLYKRDSRATVLWVGFIWLVPLFGAVIYLLLGINRIRRRALSLRANLERYQAMPREFIRSALDVAACLPQQCAHLASLATLMDNVMSRPLLAGNQIDPLVNGDAAFPAMLDAIECAQRSLTLSTYIFDRDETGFAFADALSRAVQRGVHVRVLIDDTGARYSWPAIVGLLKRRRIPVARFLPNFTPRRPLTINLRNHSKIMVADGVVGFTGGINIRHGNVIRENPRTPVQDLHFKIRGPVVSQLQAAFSDDWFFTTREELRSPLWFPPVENAGSAFARGISDGPDEDFEKFRWTLLGGLSCAKDQIQIMTPYFLPDQALISALNTAALRGVAVDILLPSKSNLPYVHWAMMAQIWQMIERGCRVWLTPPPFDHSKLMIVDHHWSLIGSANWDPRSLRLNFEFNVECYDAHFASALGLIVQSKLNHSERLTLDEVDRRPFPVRLRDGVARLASPFL